MKKREKMLSQAKRGLFSLLGLHFYDFLRFLLNFGVLEGVPKLPIFSKKWVLEGTQKISKKSEISASVPQRNQVQPRTLKLSIYLLI